MELNSKRTDGEQSSEARLSNVAHASEETNPSGQSTVEEVSELIEDEAPIVTEVALASTSNREISVDLSPLGEFKYYRPPSRQPVQARIEELPPDFFEHTTADVKAVQASLASRSSTYQNAPLKTDKIRQREYLEQRDKLPTATLRIQFADRSMLEKTFPSTYPIKPVYAFVRACLHEDAISHKFVLFERHPRRDLKVSDPAVKEKTLYDLHLAPQSILHFRFLDENVQLDSPTGPPPLLSAILSRATDLYVPPSEETKPPVPPSEPPAVTGTKPVDQSEREKKISRLLKLTKGRK